MTPPPMIRIFLTNPPAERIALVQEERALGGDEGSSLYGRNDLSRSAVEPLVGSGEAAADHALLHPGLAFGELAVGGEAGELGACAGAARRAVVGLARAQHEVARVRAGAAFVHELHMIDVGKPLRVDRLADAPAHVSQSLDVLDVENLAVILDQKEPVPAPRNVA